MDCLENCKSRMNELEVYLNVIRQCDRNIASIEASIHALASTFEKSLRIKEQELVEQICKFYGDDTEEFLKRRDELDEFYEQIKNTCSLTELVIHGKDIELLLVKKQLLDKFHELESVELEPLPENLNMHIQFQPGQLNLGTLTICEMTPTDDDECEGQLEDDDEQQQPKKTFTSISTQTDSIDTNTQAIQVNYSFHFNLSRIRCCVFFRRLKKFQQLMAILFLKMEIFLLMKTVVFHRNLHPLKHHHRICTIKVTNYLVVFVDY